MEPTTDEAYDAVASALTVEPRRPGLVGLRRAGDEAILLFEWPPEDRLFGAPVSLTWTGRRLDWDRPARDLDEWVESLDIWLLEDVENYYRYQSRRRRVDDYIELGQPGWPIDGRFALQVDGRTEPSCALLRYMGGTTSEPHVALAARKQGTLLAWVFAYENNRTGAPVVGHSTVVREGPGIARLADLCLDAQVPATVAVDLVRRATHTAAAAGARVVRSNLDLARWHPDLPRITGFRPGGMGAAVDTDFLAEDADRADALLREALTDPGRWGDDRDRAGRYLPASRSRRLLHRLRHGVSGTPPRMYAG